ncbi:MAG: phosphotransferase family protein [Caulobacterales bacterium]
MFVPGHRLLRTLRRELSALYPEPHAEASLGQAMIATVKLLEARERGGAKLTMSRLHAMSDVAGKLAAISPGETDAELKTLKAEIEKSQSLTCAEDLESARQKHMVAMEAAFSKLTASAALGQAEQKKLLETMVAWEVADRRLATTVPADGEKSVDTSITQEKMERYLQDRFKEPSLKITEFKPLPGGFGKLTILMDVEGKALNGKLVLRRDPSDEPTVDNDCHRIRNEYHVLRAAFEAGFPAPDALWLETGSDILPGFDFIIMRCAPGETGGNVFRSKDKVSDQLYKVLAEGMATLHTLPPLVKLGDLTDSIRAEWWGLPIPESVRRYLQGWFDIYMANAHNPSPSLMSLYGWLLANVPPAEGRSVLLHGDIGFHNMLVDDGRLSALVDWEFAHIGDPAEDLGYVKNIIDGADWDKFMGFYRAAGGADVSPERLHYFQVWAHVRNGSASNLTMGKFDIGSQEELKLAYTGHFHLPLFLQAAFDLIEAGPGGKKKEVDY